jgi:hypothetical protein
MTSRIGHRINGPVNAIILTGSNDPCYPGDPSDVADNVRCLEQETFGYVPGKCMEKIREIYFDRFERENANQENRRTKTFDFLVFTNYWKEREILYQSRAGRNVENKLNINGESILWLLDKIAFKNGKEPDWRVNGILLLNMVYSFGDWERQYYSVYFFQWC